MPADSAITDLGRELIDQLPTWARDDPDMRAVQHCFAKEAERQRDMARAIRADLIPATASGRGLGWWERELGLTVEPVGLTVDMRRGVVLAELLQITAGSSGLKWEAALESLVGAGVTYAEESPYTVRVTVPFPPTSLNYMRLERLARRFTPAHLELIFQSEDGFVLDESQLDQEPFHAA